MNRWIKIFAGAAAICAAGSAVGVGLNFDAVFKKAEAAEEKSGREAAAEKEFTMELNEAKAVFDSGTAVFVDARDPADYAAGHIRGAVNLPWEEFAAAFPDFSKKVPSTAPVITYCSGTDCEMSKNLGRKLRSMGYASVKVFAGGWPQWMKAGYPVEKKK